MTGKLGGEGKVWTKFEKGGGVHKIKEIAPHCQQYKETSKICNSSHYTPPPHPILASPISSKNFPSPITVIFENLIPPTSVFFQDNRLSRIIPRRTWDVACIALLLSTSGGCNNCFRFPTINDFICVLFWIWVKTHFPLKGSCIYLCQVVIQFKSRDITIMDHKKQSCATSK